MKITMITPAFPYKGGIAASSERLAQELQRQGHEVTIYTFTLQYPSFLFPGKSQFSNSQPPKGLKIFRKINAVNPLNWLKVGNELKRKKDDLIIVRYWLPLMGPCFGTILRIVKKNKYTQVLGLVDNLLPHESRVGDQQFTRYFLQPIDCFMTMSRKVLDDLRPSLKGRNAAYVKHPIYDTYGKSVPRAEALKRLQLGSDKKYILFFGFIRKYKGLDLLLDAMADTRIQNSNIELIVAGEYFGNEEDYKQQIAQLGIAEKLHLFTEYIPDEEVRYYFGAAAAVVQPYKSATQSGVSQIAYHFDKPMIVTEVGGLPEFVPDDKVGYVVPIDKKVLADKILQLFESDNISRFEAAVKVEKQAYAWDRFVEKLFLQLK